MAAGRTCVFCGKTPVTNEHVYPQWIGRKVQVKGSILLSIGKHQVRQTPALDVKVKVVCRTCNQGWLSDLEGRFADKMLPVIGGDSAQLDEAEQTMVALWAAKTWLLVEKALKHDRGWSYAAPAILEFLYREQRPPREMSVWIGGLLPGHTTLAWVSTMVVNEPPVGVIGMFTVGNLAFHIYSPLPPTKSKLGIGPDLSRGWLPIWPVEAPKVTIPPVGLFDIEDMDRIWRTGRIEIPVVGPPPSG